MRPRGAHESTLKGQPCRPQIYFFPIKLPDYNPLTDSGDGKLLTASGEEHKKSDMGSWTAALGRIRHYAPTGFAVHRYRKDLYF